MSASTQRLAARVVFGGAALVLVGFLAFSLKSGFAADACAKRLVEATQRRDAAYVERAVKTPIVRDMLLSASEVEVGFVRPMSSDLTRVGLFVRGTATATRAEVVGLVLSAAGGECEFVRDYESGPFGGK